KNGRIFKMESLQFWLEQVSKNGDGKTLTQWEIEVLFTEMTKFSIPQNLEVRILPLLIAIRERGKGHKHKANIAMFAMKIIEDFKSTKKFDSDFF
ncbi:MAG: hypothetical protein ACKPDM_02650, partial [Dolichospermum sp.]